MVDKARALLCDEWSVRVYDTVIKASKQTSDVKALAVLAEIFHAEKVGTDQYLGPDIACIHEPETFLDKQYFDLKIVSIDESTVFLDAGAYVGDTIERFLRYGQGKFAKIYAFEPSPNNFRVLESNVQKNYTEDVARRIHLFNCGLSLNEETLYFSSDTNTLGGGSAQMDENLEAGELRNISTVLRGGDNSVDDITFVKMDIEGAEMDALRSMADMIKKNTPTLAICVYHKPEDLWEIPLYIHELSPKYKIYLRHYSNCFCETVCYAVAKN